MLKVILVDDEQEILLGLEQLIDWNGLGFEVALSTTDPREALARAAELKPAVVLTDIKMPQMSGLDLIAELNALCPAIHAIILSGYDDFLMAKRALNYGVMNYLLKPADEDELCETLVRIRARYEQSAPPQSYFAAENDARIKERMFLRLFDGTAAYLPEQELLAFSRLNHNAVFSLALLKASGSKPPYAGFFAEAVLPLLSSFGEFYYKEYDGFWAVVILGKVDKEDFFARCGLAGAEYAQQRALFAALSRPESDLSLIPSLTASMRAGLDRAIFFCEAADGVYCPDANGGGRAVFTQWESKSKMRHIKAIEQAVTRLQFDVVEQVMLDVRGELCAMSRRIEPRDAVVVYSGLVTHLNELLRTFNVQPGRLQPMEMLLASLSICRDIDELVGKCIETVRAVVQGIMLSFRSTRHHINLIKYYLKLHLAEDLTLRRVADAFYFNSSYLSTLFARETGQTFRDYVMELRLERAAYMLRHTPAVIEDIAAGVGFASDKTFYKQFKRRFGRTPGEYRAQDGA